MAEDTSAMVEQRTREAYERLTSKWENREKEHKRKQREDESVSSFNDWLNKEERPRQRRELEAFNKKQGLNTERIQLTTNSLLAAVKRWISALAFMRQCGEQLYQCDGRWAIQAYDLLHELDVRELPVAPCKPTNGWTIEAEIRALESVRNTLVDAVDGRAVCWDKATEARNKWLYDQCCKKVPYGKIIIKLEKKPMTWERLGTPNGIKKAANAYAERHDLVGIPKRTRGAPRKRNRK